MPGVGFGILFLVSALGVPFLLYRLLDVEDPDHGSATTWDDARQRARNDGSRRAQGDRKDDGDDPTDGRHHGVDDRGVEGNHWS